MIKMPLCEKDKAIRKTLINWYRTQKISLPWRQTSDPYRILVAEVMLQRTTRQQVAKVYDAFLRRFPSTKELAQGPVQEIEEIVAPLGLRRRGTLLKRLSEAVEEEYNGRIPESESELMNLPGIGEYIASAIRCFAYQKRVPVIDVNVIRVLRRIYMTRPNSNPQLDSKVKELTKRLLPKRDWVAFNFAILDFGGSVCRARWTKCEGCPLRNLCCWNNSRHKKNLGI